MPVSFTRLLQQYDPQNVHGSVLRFGAQARQAWTEVRRLKIPSLKGKVDAIVVAAMGGSALGAHVLQTACAESLRVPIVIVNDYHLPAWVGKRTLVVLSSYSGTTEETLAALKVAQKRGAKVFVQATGGALGRAAKRESIPAYIFTPRENPSNQPRLGLGYGIFGLLGLLSKAGLLTLPLPSVEQAIRDLERYAKRLDLRKSGSLVTVLTAALLNRQVFVVGAEHTVGAAHILANQLNETAKGLATYFAIPELNHHLMEGLAHPKVNTRKTTFFFLHSNLYHPRILKRFRLTSEVVLKNAAKVASFRVPGQTRFSQAVHAVAFGGALTLALGLRNHINPATINWVNYFKKKLG